MTTPNASDHITECPACYTEVQFPCEFADHAAELSKLRARLADRERRIRAARKLFIFTDDQWDELRDYARHYLDAVARAVRAVLLAEDELTKRRPLPRGKRK
jgi:alkanesulfonate monooxygenase SsuD/methylene tetrahydromethanopterin reductase-like flavin-dependent oxidoreductase (luciferase family)